MQCRCWNSRFARLDQLYFFIFLFFLPDRLQRRAWSNNLLALREVNLVMNYSNNRISATYRDVSCLDYVTQRKAFVARASHSTYQCWFGLETRPATPPKKTVKQALSLLCDATFFSGKWNQLLVWMWQRRSRENHVHRLIRKEIHKMRRVSLSLSLSLSLSHLPISAFNQTCLYLPHFFIDPFVTCCLTGLLVVW